MISWFFFSFILSLKSTLFCVCMSESFHANRLIEFKSSVEMQSKNNWFVTQNDNNNNNNEDETLNNFQVGSHSRNADLLHVTPIMWHLYLYTTDVNSFSFFIYIYKFVEILCSFLIARYKRNVLLHLVLMWCIRWCYLITNNV